ncbi:HAD-IC family P-type ATPase [Leucothrix arctica]|uniref:P-type ATPase A domain-containing protein n=1 Tax=Leucothrix arctica TaxID=1481894 RepID=A0A317CLK8_9GAMM|nr:HAD-IC family P-type ATPase [Leucothrix arctica]PWQ97170.1 hypothetical protein DKT75_07600 [Leucothrix arctica]
MLPGLIIVGVSAFISLRALNKKQQKRLVKRKPRVKRALVSQQELLIKQPEKSTSESQRDFTIASGSLGLALSGYLFSPYLVVLSIGGLAYLTVPTWKRAFHDITKRKRFTRMVLEATVLPVNLLFGHYFAVAGAYWVLYFAVRTMEKAKNNTVQNLADAFVEPSKQIVYVLREGVEVEMALGSIIKGDVLVMVPGETIPVDGVVISGHATVDQLMLTGQSQSLEKQQGEEVFAKSLLLTGHIQIRVDKAGTDSIADNTQQVLSQMTSFTDNLELRSVDNADRVALPYFVGGALTGILKSPNAGLALLWAPLDDALYAAGPLSVLNYLNIALRRGVLVRDGRALEVLRKVTTIVFDKTGSLINEIPNVVNIHTCTDLSETEVLMYAAAAHQKQIDPVALSILAAAEQQEIDLPSMQVNAYKAGCGTSVSLNKDTIQVGNYHYIRQLSIELPAALQAKEAQSYEGDYSLIYVVLNNKIIGALELRATIRSDALDTINKLHGMDYKVCIISEGHEAPTKQLAKQLGVDRYFAEVPSEDKAEFIKVLQASEEVICYVADGTKDCSGTLNLAT